MDCLHLEPGCVSRSVASSGLRLPVGAAVSVPSLADLHSSRPRLCCYRKPVGDGLDELMLLLLAGLFPDARP